MIVKIPEKRRDNKSSFQALSAYITNEFDRDNIDISRIGFADLTQYITRESVPDILTGLTVEKTIAVEVGNLSTLATAAKEMYAVANPNTRVDDPVYHYILSWPVHERPEIKDMLSAARDTIAALGMSEHQYIIAIHANTDNLHAHIEVNRVHPDTGKAHHIEWAFKTLHHAAREAEIKYGWSHDNGIYQVIELDGKKIIVDRKQLEKETDRLSGGKAQTFEAWNHEESLETWCHRQSAPVLKRLLPTFQTWDDLHDTLHQFGLRLIDSGGGGMKISTIPTDGEKPITLSASKAFRFLKRAELEAQLGKFTKPTEGEAHEQQDNTGISTADDHPDNRPDAAQYARYQQRAVELGQRLNTRPTLSKSGAATTRQERQTTLGSVLHHLSDLPLVQDTERDEMLLPTDAYSDLDDLEAQSDLDLRRPLPRGDGGRKQITPPQITYKRDPEKRLAAKLERTEARTLLLARYHKEKALHQSVRSQMLKEVKEHQAARLKAIQTHKSTRRLVIQNDKNLDPAQKQLAYSLLAQHIANSKEEAQTETQAERKRLSNAFKTLPIASYRAWVEDIAGQGDEAAIAALRGIIYQEGRDKKKKATLEELEHTEKQKARIVAPEGGTHDPKKAFNLDWHLHAGKLYFTFKDDGRPAFADNGDNISWDRALVDDDALRLSLRHAAEKWGRKLTVNGGDTAFQQRLARAAKDLGLEIINVQIQTNATSAPASTIKDIIVPITPVREIEAQQPVHPIIPIPLPTTVTGGGGRAGANPMEELVSNIRSQHPDATIITHDPANTKSQNGIIIASNTDYVAQQIAKDKIIIHHRSAMKQAAGDGQDVSVKYGKDGKAKVTQIERGHEEGGRY